ncbi:HlyU family transcriptional regulator [Vibrio kasasachensis]|uniref:HlyU family transcriptional regulator n=1 Tax=Vibrio kasasachensis TaxID=2910248 RepID=UPI003D14C048
MGLFSRLFGGPKPESKKVDIEPVEYKGFLIYQEAIEESGQYRIAGRIEKNEDGEHKIHHFIRSDVLSSRIDADEFMLKKAQMFIDQMNGKIFD